MRSLRMKMVMIMVILILAQMLTTGAFLMSGVSNFLEFFYNAVNNENGNKGYGL